MKDKNHTKQSDSISAAAEAGANRDRKIFIGLVIIFFLAIFIFNLLTPFMSDDFSYSKIVREANGFFDLIRQERHHYMTHGGRSVVHFILRCFLSMPRIVFKPANSLVFMLLSLFIYSLVEGKKKFDWVIFLAIQMGLWFFTVDFRQTVLWETGSCNYLWGSTIIYGYMALVHARVKKEVGGLLDDGYTRAGSEKSSKENHPKNDGTKSGHTVNESAGLDWLPCVGFLLLGAAAGWCNENTSGGGFLYALICIWWVWHRKKKAGRKQRISLPLVCGAVGNLFGLMMMVVSPGNRTRSGYETEVELHSGLYGLFSRFQKITLHVDRCFFTLLSVFIVLTVMLVLKTLLRRETDLSSGKGIRRETWRQIIRPGVFLFIFFATCYALILTTETQARAFFGAGLFLITGIAQLIRSCLNTEMRRQYYNARLIIYSTLAILSLHFVLMYFDHGASLARIYRDCRERENYIAEQKANGVEDVIVAKVHPDFYNEYSAIEEMELSEDPEHWTNAEIEEYFDVESVRAIDYDDWAAMTGR